MEKRLNDSCKSKKFINNLKNAIVVFSYVLIIIALIGNFAFADVEDGSGTSANQSTSVNNNRSEGTTYDNLGDEAESILTEVQGWIFRLSTFAVIIAVGSGVFIKKFSMGKQDKIELGNKLIRDSIVGFIVLNSMPVIVRTIQNMTGVANEEGIDLDTGLQYFKNLL